MRLPQCCLRWLMALLVAEDHRIRMHERTAPFRKAVRMKMPYQVYARWQRRNMSGDKD